MLNIVVTQDFKLTRDFIAQDLERISDANFSEFKDVIKENEALLNELPKSKRFTQTSINTFK